MFSCQSTLSFLDSTGKAHLHEMYRYTEFDSKWAKQPRRVAVRYGSSSTVVDGAEAMLHFASPSSRELSPLHRSEFSSLTSSNFQCIRENCTRVLPLADILYTMYYSVYRFS